jgi:hypothetical protein
MQEWPFGLGHGSLLQEVTSACWSSPSRTCQEQYLSFLPIGKNRLFDSLLALHILSRDFRNRGGNTSVRRAAQATNLDGDMAPCFKIFGWSSQPTNLDGDMAFKGRYLVEGTRGWWMQ